MHTLHIHVKLTSRDLATQDDVTVTMGTDSGAINNCLHILQ